MIHEINDSLDPLELHNTDKLLTLTPIGFSFYIPTELKIKDNIIKEQKRDNSIKQQQKKNNIIKQLTSNEIIASKYYNRSNYFSRFNILYDKLNIINLLNLNEFNKFEISIYKLKILYINMYKDEQLLIKHNYYKIIDKYAYYYKLFH